jgi:CHASE3 domain sensor protein
MGIPPLKEMPPSWRLGFVALFAISVASISLSANRQCDANPVAQSLAVKGELATLLANFRRAESTQRAYLLTGELGFLQGNSEAIVDLMPAFERVRQATADNAADQRVLVALEPVLRHKLQEMSNSIKLYQKGERDSALESSRTGETRELTGDIREAIRGMGEVESQQLATESSLCVGETMRTELKVIGLSGVVLLIALVL